jgi:antitoxin (DNA-binding transcriptional repressor) of toxin-antitoxin stability system
MKTIALNKADLNTCVADAQQERIILTHNGAPVALVVGVSGLDREQIELGTSAKFWNLIRSRRKEKTLSRSELERAIKQKATKVRRR